MNNKNLKFTWPLFVIFLLVQALQLNQYLLNFVLYLVAFSISFRELQVKITRDVNQVLHLNKLFFSQEWAKSNGVELFSSIDCMFVTLTVQETNRRPLTISLMYEATGARPASLEAHSKGKH
jgi:hypothetical protein